MSEDSKKGTNADKPQSGDRRKSVRRLLVGGGIITAGSHLPDKWVKPVVDQAILPAHAETSPATTSPPTVAPTAAPTTSPPTSPPTSSPTSPPTSSPTSSPTSPP